MEAVSVWSSSDSSLVPRKSAFASAFEKFTAVTTAPFTRRKSSAAESLDVKGTMNKQPEASKGGGESRPTLFLTFTRRKSSAAESLDLKGTMNKQPEASKGDGESRPTSFLTALPRISPRISSAHEPGQKRSRKLSTRLSQRPFWTRRNTITSTISAPLTSPNEIHHSKARDSTATIVEHRLMAPLHPPLPKSKTLDVLPLQTPNDSPGYTRPTTSSLAKRTERLASYERNRLQSITPTSKSSIITASRQTGRPNRIVSKERDIKETVTSSGSPIQANDKLPASRSRKRLEDRTPTPGPGKNMNSSSANREKHKRLSGVKNIQDKTAVTRSSTTYEMKSPDQVAEASVTIGLITQDLHKQIDSSPAPIPPVVYQYDSTGVWKRNSFQPLNMSDKTPTPNKTPTLNKTPIPNKTPTPSKTPTPNKTPIQSETPTPNKTPTPSTMCRLTRTPSGHNHSLATADSPKTPTKTYMLENLFHASPKEVPSESLTPTASGERSSTTLEESSYSPSPKTLKTLAEVKARRLASGGSPSTYRDPATLHNSWNPAGSAWVLPVDEEEEAKRCLQERFMSASPVTPTKALNRYFNNHGKAVPTGSADSSPGGERDPSPTPKVPNPRLIHTTLDSHTWSGRVTGLSDRLHSDDLNGPSPRITPSPTLRNTQTRSTRPIDHTMHNDELRYRRVFKQLYALCTTAEARESLANYQKEFWAKFDTERPKDVGDSLAVIKEMGKGKEETPVRQVFVGGGKLAMKEKMRQKFKRNSGSFGLV